ncbi:MAG TPA: ABC transporter permease [Verrucomicrobiae bacterium]|jgi:oligopeptide transport system permease protein|nr:ABC transporter permease [Verrucomicrobiae bacterium]
MSDANVAESESSRPLPASPGRRAWRRFRHNRPAVISSWFLAVLLLVVLGWPALLAIAGHAGTAGKAFAEQHDPDALSEGQFQPPNVTHWFGTDVHGRDVFSRTLYGAQISLLVGAVGTLVSLIIGVTWGAVAGYLGGRWDSGLMRFVDILYSLPSIIFVIVLITTMEGFLKDWLAHRASAEWGKFARLLFLFFGLGAVSWLTMARIVRGQVLVLRNRSFVEASRVLGAGHRHILFRHILPNILGVVIVYLALTIPAIILYESFLSYLGLGIQPPMASWGSLIADGAGQINTIRVYWWLLVFPGAMLVSTLLALNYLGDGFRDAWDVRGDR